MERSRGRRYPEPEHPYRNAFQRDRDRVIHSRAFRRLEAKTQVFTPGLSDHFRNRLTHTIEVAQIARTLANVLQLDEDLTEALALAHDIGHPPFAHAGEEALDAEMQRFGERFDHNLHALRIVESFEQRYARFPGTEPELRSPRGHRQALARFRRRARARSWMPTCPGLRPPLEAQLIDLADEVAYNTADLDDAWSAGLITAEEWPRRCRSIARSTRRWRRSFPAPPSASASTRRCGSLVDLLVTGLIEGTVAAAAGQRRRGFRGSAGVSRRGWRSSRPRRGETSRELKRFLFTPGLRFAMRWAETGSSPWSAIARAVSLLPGESRPPAAALCATGARTNRRTAWSATTSPA